MPFQAEEWPAGGKVQTEMYGLRLPGIRNLRIEGDYTEVSAGGRRVGYQIEGGPLFCAEAADGEERGGLGGGGSS